MRDGVIDWGKAIAILQEADWNGVLSCECGTSEQARRSLLHLEALLRPAEVAHA